MHYELPSEVKNHLKDQSKSHISILDQISLNNLPLYND
jgi:hypothetical protein